ncbi:MAG: PAS domain S-box protein [Acidobacteriota bacterium]
MLAAFLPIEFQNPRWIIVMNTSSSSAVSSARNFFGEFTLLLLLIMVALFVGTIQVFRDITERKRMEQILAESEEKYRRVVEGSLAGVYIHQDGIFKFVNKRFCEIMGYDYEELIDRMGPLDLAHPENKILVQKKIEERLKGQVQVAEYEARAVRKNGEIIPVRILGSTIIYRGKPAIMGTILDQSKEKALELQLIQSQKMESLGQLAGGIAHDFNNIPGIIVGSLDILKSTNPNERSTRYIDMSLEAAKRGSDEEPLFPSISPWRRSPPKRWNSMRSSAK